MFQIGEFIVYGNGGVCKVSEITKMESPGTKEEKLYYCLNPVHAPGNRIFTPVQNQKVNMRKVLSNEEAKKLIHEIPDIGKLEVENDKYREKEYKDAIVSGDCKRLISVIKTLYFRNLDRQRAGKRATSVDEKYFKIAEDTLYSELAVSMDLDEDKVKDYIESHLEK